MGFPIHTIQTDNGREFTNYGVKDRECLFDIVLKRLGIEHKTTRPFSPSAVIELMVKDSILVSLIVWRVF